MASSPALPSHMPLFGLHLLPPPDLPSPRRMVFERLATVAANWATMIWREAISAEPLGGEATELAEYFLTTVVAPPTDLRARISAASLVPCSSRDWAH